MRELTISEIEQVAGGPLPLLLIAFGKGMMYGAGVTGLGITIADALDII